MSKDEFKAKLGNMKISKQDLEEKWNEHEQQRKNKIQTVLEERKKLVRGRNGQNSLSYDNSFYMRSSKHSHSVAFLPSVTKTDLVAQKQRKEFEMSRIMKKEIDEMQIKKETEKKYELLLKREREQLSLKKLNSIRKQEEMRKLHERIQFERQYKTELDTIQEKQEKVSMEKQMLQKRQEELERKAEIQRKREFEIKVKEQQFKMKTHQILNEQDDRIEKKRESLERFLQEKDDHIKHQEIVKESDIIKKKEDKLRGIFRTLEKNTYIKEKRKQDWLDKALTYEDKLQKREYDQFMDHQKRLDEIKKQNYYRESVKKRNFDNVEDKKGRTLWKLEKIDLRSSMNQKERGGAGYSSQSPYKSYISNDQGERGSSNKIRYQ
eukprot:403341581